ncbi:AraC family transcriptional regulator [Chryseobacterium sp. T16E-39]|uniref:helix-turn-helix domain-containing protein n=1 Tax=Chryseobacterium sp. T16E-39 TaxID=2015076 RepID=UPI000B5B2D9C|nr:helix-turn-helix domain-containing protein [Chryseobacterium sp. T16E-39]ASK29211.1 AraC family transcriptional regulator [Chryseobacterium sp. T16E-39]
MQIQFYQPVNPILRKYIQGYYFMSKDESDHALRYLTFPNNFFILSACQNATVIQYENKLEIFQSSEENLDIDLVSRCISSTEIYYEQPINEITVYFKPLGIYHFFNHENSALLQNEIISSDFPGVMTSILNESDTAIQIENLENYWLSKFKEKNLDSVQNIIHDLEADCSIEEIAEKNGITRQYVNKLSKRYLAKSASEYRKVYRFRKALIQNKEMKNFTELSYENLFYDQSHFIKDFKELTKITPTHFFKKVNTDQNNIWLFI